MLKIRLQGRNEAVKRLLNLIEKRDKSKKSKDGNSGIMTQDYDFDELEKMLLKRTKS